MSSCDLRTILLLFVILINNYTTLQWIQPESLTLPQKAWGCAVGYFQPTKSIWLLETMDRALIEYNTTGKSFTEHQTPVLLISTVQSAQSYTQIGSKIYMQYSTSHLSTFDMSSKLFIPKTIQHDTPWGWGCITSLYQQYLLLVGGVNTDFRIFDLNGNIWLSNGPNIPQPRDYHTCNVVNNWLYAIGGHVRGENHVYYDSVIKIYVHNIWTINNVTWIALNGSLNRKRETLRSVVHNMNIYVLGGYWTTSKVDIINSETDRITIAVGDMVTSVWWHAAVIVPWQNRLYSFGGRILKNGGIKANMTQYAILPTPEPTTSNPTLSTMFPTMYPTSNPTAITAMPTMSTSEPSVVPTYIPTLNPTKLPTFIPTKYPTINPTKMPTFIPTKSPSKNPSSNPTSIPTITPSNNPSKVPTNYPSEIPTTSSNDPSYTPTNDPLFITSISNTVFYKETDLPDFEDQQANSRNKSSTIVSIMVLLSLVVLLTIVVGVYYFHCKNKSKKQLNVEMHENEKIEENKIDGEQINSENKEKLYMNVNKDALPQTKTDGTMGVGEDMHVDLKNIQNDDIDNSADMEVLEEVNETVEMNENSKNDYVQFRFGDTFSL